MLEVLAYTGIDVADEATTGYEEDDAVITGYEVVDTTVERAGQFVTVAAHEVMVISSVV